MTRTEYIERLLKFMGGYTDDVIEKILDKLAEYLVNAGEENEAEALARLGTPEVLGMKIVSNNGEIEFAPYEKTSENKVKTTTDAVKEKTKPKKNVKRMIIILGLLVVTSPVWVSISLVILVLLIIFICLSVIVLSAISIGGCAFTVFGVMKLMSFLPIGLMMIGIGLLLLSLSLVFFVPILKLFFKITIDVIYRIFNTIEGIFDKANKAEV